MHDAWRDSEWNPRTWTLLEGLRGTKNRVISVKDMAKRMNRLGKVRLMVERLPNSSASLRAPRPVTAYPLREANPAHESDSFETRRYCCDMEPALSQSMRERNLLRYDLTAQQSRAGSCHSHLFSHSNHVTPRGARASLGPDRRQTHPVRAQILERTVGPK